MKTLFCFLLSAFCFSAPAAVSFDGADDVLGTATNGYSGPLPITVSAWIFVAGNHEGSAGARNGIICERLGLTATRGWNFLSASENTGYGTNTLVFFASYASAAVQRSSSPESVPRSQWNHVAVTWAGTTSTNDITFYVNGNVPGYRTAEAGSGAWVADPNLNFTIGSRFSTTTSFNGQIAEVAVWTNVLTAAEIGLLAGSRTARRPLMVRPAALVGYWPMDGGPESATCGAAGSITDLSGRGNHASPTNSPIWKASPLSYP